MKLLDDIGLKPGEAAFITGTGGKTTLLWHLADLASRRGRVIASVTAKMLPPEEPHYDKLLLDPADYDPAGHDEHRIQLVAAGKNSQGKLLGISCQEVQELSFPDRYLILEADGSRGRKLKMWFDHEPPVCPMAGLTLGILPITALHETIGDNSVYNPEGFQKATGLKTGDQVTREALAEMALSPQGMFRHSRGRRVLLINQCDSDRLFQNALDLSRFIAEDERSQHLSAIICLSLKELNHEDHRHYSCRRLVPPDAKK